MSRVLVIGSGGREHAICWKLLENKNVSTVFVLPGSSGIAQINNVEIVSELEFNDFKGIAQWCLTNKIDLVVVGPEDPLANGITGVLANKGIKCFGPSKTGALIEADKNWSKDFMIRHNIPTAKYKSFTNAEEAKQFIRNAPFEALVVKASGLAAGKGVIVAKNIEEACSAVDEILEGRKFGTAGDCVVVEELLVGEEVSVLAFVDSNTVRVLPPAQDHKRLKDNDQGGNTGGMGAYCPCPLISKTVLNDVKTHVLQKAVDGLRMEGIAYNGILYAGMMLTANGPKTLEFNCRFGDPETQVILPLLKTDLFDVMMATVTNKLKMIPELEFESNRSAVGVVMASKGYPETSTKGCVIKGIDGIVSKQDLLVFHSGTAKNEKGEWVTNGGRVLINVAVANSLKEAAQLATNACEIVTFDGAQYRRDIAKKAFGSLSITYKDSGVDVEAGDTLVKRIRPLTRGTNRSGVIGEIGSFGGLFRLNEVKYVNQNGEEVKYKDPVLVQGTDGVGTKLKIASEMHVWDSIGIDLVAMCVNDVLCNGAEPLAFLDYIACGHLDVPTASLIVKGISVACRESNCALLGGETAEMPSMYDYGDYDLAGYCVGVVEHENILPKMNEIHAGDIVVGLPSDGIHSNGYSLIHKILKESGTSLADRAPFDKLGRTIGREMLKPTKLYVADVLPLLRKGHVKAIAHITGGGLSENIPRILPAQLGVQLDAVTWNVPPVFGWLAAKGNVQDNEMLRTFNCGIGMVIILPRANIDWEKIPDAKVIGSVVSLEASGSHQVQVKNFESVMKRVSEPFRSEIEKASISYKDSGVDIVAGDSLVKNIKPFAKSTDRDGVLGSLGGFGGLFRLKDLKKTFKDPVLVLGTDGVGTKLKIAQELNKHETVGIDLVAMCVNDILCNGAEPLSFLDYFACGKLDVDVATKVISGITEGCRQSGSSLLGGETAEMPGMYEPNVYDLAGFAVGITEYEKILPKRDSIKVNDIIIGFPSSGVHSNGFSLIRKLLMVSGLKLSDTAPFSATGKSFGEELLVPTRIYVKDVLPAIETGFVKALAHITGGGLWDNIPRVLPAHLTAELNGKVINIQPIFGWMTSKGVDKLELMKTFNCGVGMILIASPEHEFDVLKALHGSGASVIGKVIPTKANGHQLIVRHFATCVERVEKLLETPKKRVAVLISGSGSNLQALIDATRNTSLGMCSEIVHVISNKAGVKGLERASDANISSTVISNKDFPTREAFDEALHSELVKHNVEIVCLAGFMRILTAGFVQKWRGKLINIHPSLLPKHKGIHVQQAALDAGDTESGCTVHFVDEHVDTGANIVQEIVPIIPSDTAESLSARILTVEHIAFPKALRLLAAGYIRLNEKSETEWV